MTNANLILYTLLASAAVVGAVFVVISRTATRGALGLGVVALAAAGLVGAFANAPLVAVALVLLQGSVIAAVYLVGLMIQPIRADSSTPGSEHTADHALEPVPSSAGRWLGLSAVAVVVAEDQSGFHRVQVGPFSDQAEVARVRALLEAEGYQPIVRN